MEISHFLEFRGIEWFWELQNASPDSRIFAVTPIGVMTVAHVHVRQPPHERSILELAGLGVLNRPDWGLQGSDECQGVQN